MPNFRKIPEISQNRKTQIKQIRTILDYFRRNNIPYSLDNYTNPNGTINGELFLSTYNNSITRAQKNKKNVKRRERRQTLKEIQRREAIQNAIEANKRQFELLKTKQKHKKYRDVVEEINKLKYMIYATIRRTFKRTGQSYVINFQVGPYKGEIDQYLDELDMEDDYKIDKLIDYKIVFMKIRNRNISQSNQLMRKDYILKNNWLRFAEGISNNAFKNTNNKCVYYQLCEYLMNPNTGRPTKFICKGQRMNDDNLYSFFHSLKHNDKFDIYSGVSTEMVKILCKEIKRNMYAYDADDKCFDCIIDFDSKNYAPIVFYKMNGHMYLIDNPKVIKQVAESNKQTAKKIISQLLEEKPNTEQEEITLYKIDKFNVDEAKTYAKGIYLIQKSNLLNEVLSYIEKHNEIPKTKNNDNSIVKFTYKNNEKQIVHIVVDANYGLNIEYDDIKQVADFNNIPYINEGIGNVIKLIIEHSKNVDVVLPTFERLKKINNDEKIVEEIIEEESSFNDTVWEKIMKTIYVKTWQFVEIVDKEHDGLRSFKVDMKKCRRNILYYSKYNFPVYSVMDIPKPYSGIIRCGMYFVETENVYPMRGSGWYVEPLVKYCIDNNIINHKNIIY